MSKGRPRPVTRCCRRILVAYGDKIGYAVECVRCAWLNLSQADVGITCSGTGSTNATTTPTPTPSGSTTGTLTAVELVQRRPRRPTSTNALLVQLNAALTALSNAYKTGDLGAIGTNRRRSRKLLQQYLASLPASSAPASSTPTSSPTPTPTKSVAARSLGWSLCTDSAVWRDTGPRQVGWCYRRGVEQLGSSLGS